MVEYKEYTKDKTVDLFDCLTEKEKARAKRKGLWSIKLDKFLDKLPIPQKLADVIRDIYWNSR